MLVRPVLLFFNFTIPRGDVGPQGPQGANGSGSGDMSKSVYDTNANNIVDAAESVPWTGITGKPSTFAPSAHASSHVTGTDVIAPASSSTAGLLKQLSGNTTDYVNGTNACSNLITTLAGLLVPTGSVLEFAGSAAPTGFLLCDGTLRNRTTYAALFAVIGTTYGIGDGSTTFGVPDKRGRVAIGAGTGTGLTLRTLGVTGGEETHALTVAELAAHNHTATQVAHNHTATDSGHNHDMTCGRYGGGAGTNWAATGSTAGASALLDNGAARPTSNAAASITVANATPVITVNNNGSGTAHNTMMPFVVCNYIIKI